MILTGRFYIGGRFVERDVLVEEGKIRRVGANIPGKKRRLSGLVIPGAIDIHTHLREPGHEEKEDFASGTRAAARGGVTCVLDMPNNSPPTKYPEDVDDKSKRLKAKAHIDWGLYALLSSPTLAARVSPLVAGFKVFLAASTGDLRMDHEDLEGALASPALAGKVVAVHAEDESRFVSREISGLDAWNEARPEAAEESAVRHVCDLAGKFKGPGAPRLHLCHLTAPASLRSAREVGVSHEVAPRHLLLSADGREGRALGPKGKVNPPLRSERTREGLVSELKAGRITILASDHAPHLPEEKEAFASAESGMPELEWVLPVLLAQAKRGEFPVERVIDAFTTAPAALFGMRKGKTEPGFDADFAAFDARKSRKVGKLAPLTKCGWSPYSAFDAVFPNQVMVRGEPVVEDGEVVGEPGQGRRAAPCRASRN